MRRAHDVEAKLYNAPVAVCLPLIGLGYNADGVDVKPSDTLYR
ncbi:MAG: hypothetical protein QW514_07610 [Thermoprotei archaeon]